MFLLAGASVLGVVALYGIDKKTRAMASMNPPAYRVDNGPLVSVVIPTLQEEDYLPQLLTSISNQTWTSVEAVISDSSPPESKEATAALVREWERRLVIRMVDVPKKNVSLGRNAGAVASRGEYLLFMDADCIMEPDYIEKMVRDMKTARLVHGLDAYYNNDALNSVKAFWLMAKPRMHTTGRGVMVRAADFYDLGGYDIDIDPSNSRGREDLDFGLRIENVFGPGSVFLDRNAVIAENYRRAWGSPPDRVWDHRGWRKGKAIDGI